PDELHLDHGPTLPLRSAGVTAASGTVSRHPVEPVDVEVRIVVQRRTVDRPKVGEVAVPTGEVQAVAQEEAVRCGEGRVVRSTREEASGRLVGEGGHPDRPGLTGGEVPSEEVGGEPGVVGA